MEKVALDFLKKEKREETLFTNGVQTDILYKLLISARTILVV